VLHSHLYFALIGFAHDDVALVRTYIIHKYNTIQNINNEIIIKEINNNKDLIIITMFVSFFA
jgi:hypothetical protein